MYCVSEGVVTHFTCLWEFVIFPFVVIVICQIARCTDCGPEQCWLKSDDCRGSTGLGQERWLGCCSWLGLCDLIEGKTEWHFKKYVQIHFRRAATLCCDLEMQQSLRS